MLNVKTRNEENPGRERRVKSGRVMQSLRNR